VSVKVLVVGEGATTRDLTHVSVARIEGDEGFNL
jgi:hypothetical protein